MTLRSRIRSAITGQYVNSDEAAANPATTVRETYSGGDEAIIELRAAAEGVILGEGYADAEGRTEINEADLERLKDAIGWVGEQP